MSGWDVSDADMPNIPGSQRADVPELPDGALEALLTGDLVTDEACAGLQPAAALLAALNAAPHDGELAGHARVLAEFRHRGGRPVHARRSARRRSRLLTVLLTAKAAAAAAAAAVALGGVAAAAYTSILPAPVQQFAHSVIGAPSPQPRHRPGTPQPSHGPGTPQATPARTDAGGPAAFGLCTAYAHAKAHGTAAHKAVAFRNLAAAAGGAAKIAAYCATVPHPGSSQSSQPASAPTHPAGHSASHPTGKPSSHPTPHPPGRPSSAPTTH